MKTVATQTPERPDADTARMSAAQSGDRKAHPSQLSRYRMIRLFLAHRDVVRLEEARLKIVKQGQDITRNRLITDAIRRYVWVLDHKADYKALTGAACLMLVCAAAAHAQGTAYGTDIKAAATNLYATMRGIGGVVMAIGLSMCGFKVFVQHDTEHLRSAMLVTAGGVLIMVAPSLVSALQSVTSGTTQTFQ